MGDKPMANPTNATNQLEHGGLDRRLDHESNSCTVQAKQADEGRSVFEVSTTSVATVCFGLSVLSTKQTDQATQLVGSLLQHNQDFGV